MSTKPLKIYIAGRYSDNNILGCLNNIHDGIKAAVAVLKLGHVPFCPWTDFLFQMFDKSLTVEDYYRYSMAWLEVSDEVWVLPDSGESVGTQKEIERAYERGIPVGEYEQELAFWTRKRKGDL